MNAAHVEQLLLECHPEWTGFSSELVSAAVRSSLGRRTLLNRLAPRFGALQRLDRPTTHTVSPDEDFAVVASTCWLPAATLKCRLTTLGACFYLQQICAEIRRPQVTEWKAVLGLEQYQLVIRNVRSCLSENLNLPSTQLRIISHGELIAQDHEHRQQTLAVYGLFTMLSVAKTLAPNTAIFDELSMRLGSLFQPDRLLQWFNPGLPADTALCERTNCLLALWQAGHASLKA
jgi:hypothetical protein